ncbi:rRNA maturation RNase YbeY [Candidatus Shapirobacteria bacterium]|nr:rRNA maturation RNase YbeY [Candidatus Shapirobacteria bacterium]
MIIQVKKDPRYRIKMSFLKKTAQEILKDFGLSKSVELGIALVGKRKAKSLNQTFRKQDYVPAVLSFPYREETLEKNYLLGEVVICFPLAREKAVLENQTLERAMADLLKHGIKNLVNIE